MDIFKYSRVYESSIAWKGKALSNDLVNLLVRFLGIERTRDLLNDYTSKYGSDWKFNEEADFRFVNYIENSLSSVIGNASARLLVSSIVDEDQVTHTEVIELLEQAQKLLKDNRELKETHQQLLQAKSELELANAKLKENDELKDEFLTTVTHELRTPITSIRALSEILYNEPNLDHEQRQIFMETIISETIRISKIIDSVLDLEKYESGKQVLNATLCKPHEIIKKSINLFHSNASFNIKLCDKTQLIFVDPDKMIQLFVNLISNSINHNPEQKIQIDIESYTKNNFYEIIFRDNGKGINDSDLPYIFDKFYQSKFQTSKKPVGSGLGLAICQKIISLHKGTIEASNNPQGGVKFCISIPIQDKNS